MIRTPTFTNHNNHTNASGNSAVDVYTKVRSTMQAQNKTAPVLNAALTADTTQLSGLGQLKSALAAFQGVALSFSGNGPNLSAQNVTNLVHAYNTLNTQLNTLKQGALKTDGSALHIQNQLMNILTSSISGTTGASSQALANIGITIKKNGALAIDANKLQKAISADPASVAKVFTHGGNGIAEHLASQIQGLISPGGSLAQKTKAINQDISALNVKKASLEKTLTAQAQALVQFYSQQNVQGSSPGVASTSTTSFNGNGSLLNYLR